MQITLHAILLIPSPTRFATMVLGSSPQGQMIEEIVTCQGKMYDLFTIDSIVTDLQST